MAFNQPRRRLPVDVNLTPLIDVVFLLLIFFMVTTTFTKESRLSIQLPEAEGVAQVAEQDVLEVIIDSQGFYAINGQRLSNNDKASLAKAITAIAGKNRDQTFLISADAQAPHQSVVTVMELAGELAFSGVSIATQKGGDEQ